jgi:hypothetical protein
LVKPHLQRCGARSTGVAGDGLRGTVRALQVAAVDMVNAFVSQGFSCALGLPMAARVQADVELALDTRIDVPRSLAVAHRGDAGRGHSAPPQAGAGQLDHDFVGAWQGIVPQCRFQNGGQ